MTPLPPSPLDSGPLWSVGVPALLLLVTLAATIALYRHFARPHGDDRRGE